MHLIRKRLILLLFITVLFLPTMLYGEGNEVMAEPETPTFENASVHDPSIIQDRDSGRYYVFGSHIAAAKSDDLISWNNFTNGYKTPGNTLYGNLSENLAASFEWAGEDDADSSGGFAVWAPDVFWNKDYVNEDGSKGAYMIYYSVSSTYIRSAIGVAVSQDMEGPYKYVDTIMYSGFHNEEAYDANSDVNKHWENTNLSDLIEEGVIDEVNPDWFTEEGAYNNSLYTNAIDANILYDENGKLWMTYGSWSGGTFVLELDKETGLPIYPGEDGQTSDGRMIDRYFGTKIAGGYGRSGEGTYAVYDEASGYYYLYITYGGLASDGGYQIRQFRSENIDGPYVDAAGNQAVFPESFDMGVGNFPGNDDHKQIGNKMIGNFLFERALGEAGEGIGTGYVSPGHNSYLIDDDLGKEFLVTHTRFPQQGEMHEVRVHQTFKNSNNWPVPTPYRYAGETIKPVDEVAIAGDYKYINHGKEITGDITTSSWISFNQDGSISGAVTGTWRKYDDYRAEVNVGGETYDGVFIKQWDPTAEAWVMTFSAMSGDGVVIWGSHAVADSDQAVIDGIKEELFNRFASPVISDIALPTTGTKGATITWESAQPAIIATDGTVNRPTGEDATVDMTATISLGEMKEEVTIPITVKAAKEGKLTAWYNFDDGLSDQSGNQEDATVTGNRIDNEGGEITFAEGKIGKAAQFDGNTGLRLADGLISDDSYSISLWINPEELTEYSTTFFGARTENNWISFVPETSWGNTMVWSHNGDDWYDVATDSTIPVNQWSHLALTVDDGTATFYINGEERFTGEDFPNIFTSVDGAFSLGVNYWDTPFKGLMDEVRVYDGVALPSDEITMLYENPGGSAEHPEEEAGEEGQSGEELPDETMVDGEDSSGGDSTIDEMNGQTDNQQQNQQDGNQLPHTFTNTFRYLLVGLGLFVIGGITYFIWRRKYKRI
ncbi:LamG-like jellyroll fold domain-containing protein [Paraliobacillus ryukyuensis]|uniref:LamG-like jellyroll fold domain-containing protein n=1 Tax=Paraliobacillus ryukyuensis TaxID=200904 RepID=UPI0009A72984